MLFETLFALLLRSYCVPTSSSSSYFDRTPNQQDGKSALVLAIDLKSGVGDKIQFTLMHALLDAGASVTENVREALLRDAFWHRTVEIDTSAAVVALIAAQAPDLADCKDTQGRAARGVMSTAVMKVSLRQTIVTRNTNLKFCDVS